MAGMLTTRYPHSLAHFSVAASVSTPGWSLYYMGKLKGRTPNGDVDYKWCEKWLGKPWRRLLGKITIQENNSLSNGYNKGQKLFYSHHNVIGLEKFSQSSKILNWLAPFSQAISDMVRMTGCCNITVTWLQLFFKQSFQKKCLPNSCSSSCSTLNTLTLRGRSSLKWQDIGQFLHHVMSMDTPNLHVPVHAHSFFPFFFNHTHAHTKTTLWKSDQTTGEGRGGTWETIYRYNY